MTNNNSEWTGVILAAGKGVRAYPTTAYIPKVLMNVAGKTLLERNAEIMHNILGIKNIIIVIGYLGEQVIESVKQWKLDVNITFVTQKEQKGIGHALLKTEKYIKSEKFVVILGDELYIGSDHKKLNEFKNIDFDGVLIFKEENDPQKIAKNYTGTFKENRVLNLVEKPKNPKSGLMGLGSYLLTKKIFHYLRITPKSELRGEVEITDALSNMAENENVYYKTLNIGYMNVTTKEDWNLANYTIKNINFDTYKISVIIPAHNEEKTIANVVEDYLSHNIITEVIVVNNNSKDNTKNIALNSGAKVIDENKKGYGFAVKAGINHAIGDIIILTESNGHFRSKDIYKLLEYIKDCDFVTGTRTRKQMIEIGSDMTFILRTINIILGKFTDLLWWNIKPDFTDTGCTYRAFWKYSYNDVKKFINSNNYGFNIETVIAMLKGRKRVLEIPVSYYKNNYCKKTYLDLKNITKLLQTLISIIKNRIF